jgi:hypothetical protein
MHSGAGVAVGIAVGGIVGVGGEGVRVGCRVGVAVGMTQGVIVGSVVNVSTGVGRCSGMALSGNNKPTTVVTVQQKAITALTTSTIFTVLLIWVSSLKEKNWACAQNPKILTRMAQARFS